MAATRGSPPGYLISQTARAWFDRHRAVGPGSQGARWERFGVSPLDLCHGGCHAHSPGSRGRISEAYAAMYPAAEVVVHELGAEPGRPVQADGQRADGLRRRARRAVRGARADPGRPDQDRGADRSVDLGGGRPLESHYSPGHAKHHVGLVDTVSGDLYVGDAAGIYIPETGDQRPATPPPDFDLGVALESLLMFAALRPVRLLFSHYGPVTAVDQALDRSAEEIKLWVEETRQAGRAGLDLDHAVAMVAERTRARTRSSTRRRPRSGRQVRQDRRGAVERRWHHALAGQDRRPRLAPRDRPDVGPVRGQLPALKDHDASRVAGRQPHGGDELVHSVITRMVPSDLSLARAASGGRPRTPLAGP